MKPYVLIFWIIWVSSVTSVFLSGFVPSFLFLLLILVLLAMLMLTQQKEMKLRKIDILNSLDKIGKSMEKIYQEVSHMKKQQTSQSERVLEIEKKLDEHKKNQEKAYRDVVRKVLELDNKFMKKYNMLGEAIIELSKKKEKNK